jgi:hypothetical protein
MAVGGKGERRCDGTQIAERVRIGTAMEANRDLYGERISARQVLRDGTRAPTEPLAFMRAFRREQRAIAQR